MRRFVCFAAVEMGLGGTRLMLKVVGSAGQRRPGLHGAAGRKVPARCRTSSASGHADARGSFGNAGAELEEAQPERGELGFAQAICRGHGVAQRQHQPVGGGVQNEADLVGDR